MTGAGCDKRLIPAALVAQRQSRGIIHSASPLASHIWNLLRLPCLASELKASIKVKWWNLFAKSLSGVLRKFALSAQGALEIDSYKLA